MSQSDRDEELFASVRGWNDEEEESQEQLEYRQEGQEFWAECNAEIRYFEKKRGVHGR